MLTRIARHFVAPVLAVGVVVFSAASCESGEAGEGIFVVPDAITDLKGETFFDHPFPSDARLEDGKLRLQGFPNPRESLLLDGYISYADNHFDGFSTVGAGYVRFSSGLDLGTLPADPKATTAKDASVQLIDVDPSSKERGVRVPIALQFRAEKGVYWAPNTLAFMPNPGTVLRPRTKYAFVVTRAVETDSGGEVSAPAQLREVLGLDDPSSDVVKKVHDLYAPSVDEVVRQGIAREDIAQLAVFTTTDPTFEFLTAASAMKGAVQAPDADPAAWVVKATQADFDEYEGMYGPSPNYQVGELPFTKFGDGGGFDLVDGVPQVVDTFDLRFSLSVPNAEKCPMPEAGYPIVLYAHGTTGDYRSYVGDGTARSLARECLASMGVDQIFHGTRPGAPDDDASKQVLFFNFNNIEAARSNIRQSGLDEIQRTRLFSDTQMTVPAAISTTAAPIKFDPSKILFFGHSQGSLNGPLLLAGTGDVRGGVLSGASGLIAITLTDKVEPSPSVAFLVKSFLLSLDDEEAKEVTILHPGLSLAQLLVDPVDPINYGRLIAKDPVVGEPRSVYMTEGVNPDGTGDSYAPPRGCEALAIAIGVELSNPVIFEPPAAAWGGLAHVDIPASGLSGNIAGGKATGVLSQFEPTKGDGHFVVFNIPEAKAQAAGFSRALADDPVGRCPPR